MTLFSKLNKVVPGLLTMHYDNKIDNSTGEKKKPHIIMFYNQSKGGVDVVDRTSANYLAGRTRNR